MLSKKRLEELDLKILSISKSMLAGAPVNLAKIINKYTKHKVTTVLLKPFTSPHLKNLSWSYNYITPTQKDLIELAKDSDLLLYNQRSFDLPVSTPSCILYHAQPNGYRPMVTNSELNGKKLVVAQYQTRYYTDALPVPNLIDIFRDDLVGEEKKIHFPINVYMGVASESKRGWGYKGSDIVKTEMEKVKIEFPGVCNFNFLQGRPIDEVYKVKKTADISIDDIASGSYHISSIEGLSFGSVSINNIDKQCLQNIYDISGATNNPFERASCDSFRRVIRKLIKDPSYIEEKKYNSRKWVEKFWNPIELVQKYISFFERLI